MSITTRLAAALVVAATLGGAGAQAAPLSYAYTLTNGELDFTVDSSALSAQGFGTANPAQGLLSLSLRIGSQTFQAASDFDNPSFPLVTLLQGELSFAQFDPTVGNAVYDFTAIAPGTGGAAFDYTFTLPDGTQQTGSGRRAAAVPEPAALALLATGLLGLAAARRRA